MGRLKVVDCPFLKEITGDKTKNHAAKVSLPGNNRQQGEYEKSADNGYPDRKRNRYGEDKNSEVGSHC